MASNQFMVFGFDVRDYGRLWLAAWRDVFFGDDSPVRGALDSIVSLEKADGEVETFQAGEVIDHPEVSVRAVALPDDIALTRTLTLPAVAEADLDAALQLEVSASSPFAHDDTAAGWTISRSADDDSLSVAMAIVSRGAVMKYLGDTRDIREPSAREVWAKSGDRWVVIRGFGEAARESVYKRRLVRVGIMIVIAATLVVALAGASAVLAGIELSGLEAAQRDARDNSREAIRLRDELAAVNATIKELNTLSFQLPSPQLELARLNELLPDSAYVTQYTQNGRKIRLRGRGRDAASLQQSLTDHETFLSVTAPQAISRVGNTGLEQFFLDIEVKVAR